MKGNNTETTKTATVRNSGRVVVRTKYHGPTNHRGSRISVTHAQGGKRLYVDYCYALDIEENHANAVRAYLDYMCWDGEWVTGADDTGYYAVRAN
jgi:hypothetical protein